jgi:hypothetical protein
LEISTVFSLPKIDRAMTYLNQGLNLPLEDITGFPYLILRAKITGVLFPGILEEVN